MSIESIFPVPKLLNMQSVGLDISDRSVKYVSLKKTKNSVRINTYGRQEIPAGIVESGKIINKDALAEIIRSIVKKEKNYLAFSAAFPTQIVAKTAIIVTRIA